MRAVLLVICVLLYKISAGQEVRMDTIPTASQDSIVNSNSFPSDQTTELKLVLPKHDPKRAALLSTVIPGLGQAYNKKYWKIPLVWIGLGTFAYFINFNNDQYQFYRKNLIYEVKQDPNFPNQTILTVQQLKRARDQFRRNRDQLVLYGVLFYFVQIVDAHVDAHLIEFDVNQDLSARITPTVMSPSNGIAGINLTLTF